MDRLEPTRTEKKIFEHDRIKYKCRDIAEVIFTEYGAFVGETESLSHENIGGAYGGHRHNL